MKTTLKAGLLASVSLAALSLFVAAPAHAFDEVDWRWDLNINQDINTDVNVAVNIDPTGLVVVESLQINAGDVRAQSIVSGIYNNQPAGTGTVDLGTTDITFQYGIGGDMLLNGAQSPNVTAANVDETDQMPNINGTVTATVDLGEVTVPATASLNAEANLPSVISAATAVGNNLSVESEVGVQLHVGQFAFGDGNSSPSFGFGGGGGGGHHGGSGNSNLTLADSLTDMIMDGDLVKANIKATSKVTDILNATVDSSATAVGNNLSVAVGPVSADNALVIADITQFSYADVTAKSKVRDVTISNYTGLGSLTRPIVNSTATAVGNNASISVKTPVVAAP
jgi:hypothetical protein